VEKSRLSMNLAGAFLAKARRTQRTQTGEKTMNDHGRLLRNGLLVFSLCVLCAFVRTSPAGETTAKNIGKKITPLTLKDAAGKSILVGAANHKPTVVVFFSFDCPVSTSY